MPFGGATINELKQNVCAGRYPPIYSNFSPALKDICERMLCREMERRITLKEILALPEAQQRLGHLPGAQVCFRMFACFAPCSAPT